MAMDVYMKLGDIKGESTDKDHKDWAAVTTPVQAGETNIGQVATRLGVDKGALLTANPHIKDPLNLNVGQEIKLPPHPIPKGESSTPADLQAKINQGIQDAAQNFDQIAKAVAGTKPVASQGTNLTSATDADKRKSIDDLRDKLTELHKESRDNAKF